MCFRSVETRPRFDAIFQAQCTIQRLHIGWMVYVSFYSCTRVVDDNIRALNDTTLHRINGGDKVGVTLRVTDILIQLEFVRELP